MAKKRGLDDWFGKENWVDISAPKKGGGYEKCGRKNAKDSDRGYPKCVPAAKAAKMSKKEVASAVRRKRAKKQGVGGKPTNVKTFAAEGGSIMKMKAKGMMRGGAPRAGRSGFAKGRKKPANPTIRPRPPSGPIVPGGPTNSGKPRKMKTGGMATKGYRKGGAPSKGAVSDKEFEKFKKARGKAMGGAMKTKGYAKGGAMKSKAKSSPVRAPSSKNSGLYGR